MTGLPLWNRSQDPRGLLRYVQVGAAASMLPSLPARAEGRGDGALARTIAVFDAFATAGIRYADEPVGSGDGWQAIRPSPAVLAPPRLATCVDLAVAFAGACLDAGVHPLLILLEPVAGGPAHALVVAWLGGSWTGTGGSAAYRRFAPEDGCDAFAWPGGLRSTVDGLGAYLPIDIITLAADGAGGALTSFADAVASGARLLGSGAWRITAVVDVGVDYDPRGALSGEHRRFPESRRTRRWSQGSVASNAICLKATCRTWRQQTQQARSLLVTCSPS